MKLKTIMIVDDSKVDHMITELMVEEYDAGIKVIKAYDGCEALEILQKLTAPPSAILLDINMPRMDGFEFLENYHQAGYSAPVTMLTGTHKPKDSERALAYDEVKQYKLKPLELKDFDEIARLLTSD